MSTPSEEWLAQVWRLYNEAPVTEESAAFDARIEADRARETDDEERTDRKRAAKRRTREDE